MPTNEVTLNQGYELPHPENSTAHDVERLRAALLAIDNDVATIIGELLSRAAVDSPDFTGVPKAPTQPAGTNDNTIATTGHVQLALEAFLTQAANALQIIADLEAALGEGELAETLMSLLSEKAPLASPTFTGTPVAPTPSVETNSERLATTAFVYLIKAAILGAPPTALDTLQKIAGAIGNDASFSATVTQALAAKAPLANPVFTGNPTAPTQTAGNNSTRLATTAFVQAALSALATTFEGLVAPKAPSASPTFTGTPTSPTPAAGANSTQIATTAFVQAATSVLNSSIQAALGSKAPLANPALTGNPTAPTQATGNNSTRLATTAFVQAAVAALNLGQLARMDLNNLFYTGTSVSNTNYPIGSILSANNNESYGNMNATVVPRLGPNNFEVVLFGSGTALTGTWRCRGVSQERNIIQRVA